jgi:signal transduction histidine kinase
MNSRVPKLARQYAATLRRYLVRQEEVFLQQAYELGRKAIANGLGVLDMARIHQQALAPCLSRVRSGKKITGALRAAEIFFSETLSPFEATHRGFRGANLELRQVNQALQRRNGQLAALSRDLRNLSRQVLHVQEEERKHVSRELHDEVGQALTVLNTSLGMLHRNGTVDSALLKRKIADTQMLLAQTMETVHRFARKLRPAMLDELGLLPALRSYLKNFAERTGLHVRFTASPEAENLNDDQKTVVYRVAQESLTNVAKHAHASHVTVSLRKSRHGLQIQISDNGKAFEVNRQFSSKGRKRLGLLGMRERVRLVNGRFAVKSGPGKGTTVRVEIPFKAAHRSHLKKFVSSGDDCSAACDREKRVQWLTTPCGDICRR